MAKVRSKAGVLAPLCEEHHVHMDKTSLSYSQTKVLDLALNGPSLAWPVRTHP